MKDMRTGKLRGICGKMPEAWEAQRLSEPGGHLGGGDI